MMWFDKNHPDVLYADIRNEQHILHDSSRKNPERLLDISPDIQIDFTRMPFADNTFKIVVFDPPHMLSLGKNSWMAKKYGVLDYNWRHDIKEGVNECMRVLQHGGTLIFKWNESDVKLKDVLMAIEYKPLFGHTTGRQSKTIWMAFMKL